jgi:hypothetical protein
MGRQVLVDLDDLQARSLAESSKPLIPSMAGTETEEEGVREALDAREVPVLEEGRGILNIRSAIPPDPGIPKATRPA